ncbi:retrovirus-related pol polyprotein from transposon TNT 1-94 [Tanacetum coccineum]
MRTASTTAKPCQGDSSEFYLITGSIYTDQRGTVVIPMVAAIGSRQVKIHSHMFNSTDIYKDIMKAQYKEDVLEKFKILCRKLENLHDCSLVSIVTNHSSEFDKLQFGSFYGQHGMSYNLSGPFTSQSSKIVERTHLHLTKFDPKSYEGVFLGYSQNSKAYIVLNKETMRIEESLNVEPKSSPSVKDDKINETIVQDLNGSSSLQVNVSDEGYPKSKRS